MLVDWKLIIAPNVVKLVFGILTRQYQLELETANMSEDHYEAQSKWADMWFEANLMSWFRPIKKLKAMHDCFEFLRKHKKCCEWARETIEELESWR